MKVMRQWSVWFGRYLRHPGLWHGVTLLIGLGVAALVPAQAGVIEDRLSPLHSVVDIFGITVAGLIFAAGWASDIDEQPRSALWLTGVFLALAFINSAHFVSLAEMPDFFTPTAFERATYFRQVGRVLEVIAMAGVAWAPNLPPARAGRRYMVTAISLAIVTLVYVLGLFPPVWAPALFVVGQGPTPITIAIEITLIAVWALAGARFLRHPVAEFNSSLLAAAAVFSILNEVFFLRQTSSMDIFNVLAHGCKLLAYGFIAQAVFVTIVQRPMRRLRLNEWRYRHLFENSPVAMWEEDFSAVKRRLDDLRQRGVTDMPAYLRAHPEVVTECAYLVTIVDVNNAALALMNATAKAELLGTLGNFLDQAELEAFRAELIEIASDHRRFSAERQARRLRGEPINMRINWLAAPGHSADFSNVIVAAEDVTARRQMEAALSESEERLRLSLTAAQMGVWSYDTQRDYFQWDERTYALFGMTVGDFDGTYRGFLRFMHPDDRYPTQVKVHRTLKTLALYRTEMRVRRPDGSYRWFSMHGQAFRQAQTEALQMRGVVFDITERKDAEARWHRLFENSPISLWEEDFSAVKTRLDELRQSGVTDLAAYFAEHPEAVRECAGLVRVLDVNRAAVRLLGVAKKEDLLKDLADNLKGETVAGFADQLAQIGQGVLEYQWEGNNTRVDGRVVDVRLNWKALPGHEHDWKRVMVSIEDITRRKQAEHALRASEARLRALFASMQDVVLVIDRAGTYREIAPTNPGLLYRPPEELLGQTLRDVFQPELARMFIEVIQQTLKTGRMHQIEYELPIAGRPVWFSTAVLPLTADTTLWVARDITERKQAETDLNRRMAELTVIYEAARAMQKLYSPAELGAVIIGVLEQILHYQYGAVLIIDEESRLLLPVALSEQAGGPDLARLDRAAVAAYGIRLGQGISGWVAQTGQSVRVGDVRNDPRYFAVREGIRSELCVPLRAGDRVIGIVNVETPTPYAYTEADQRLLETVASQMAIAIRNAQLYEAMQRELAERKQAEAAARVAEEKYRLMFERATVGIFQSTPAGRFLNVNPAMARLFGYDSPSEMIEGVHSIAQQIYISPEMRADFVSALARTGEIREYVGENLCKDGRSIWTNTSARMVKNSEGEVVYYEGFILDVTSRKQAEEALRASEASYRGLFNAISDAIYIQDVQGRFLDVNEGAVRMYGYPRDWFIGRSPLDVAAPGRNDLAATLAHVQRAYAGEPQQFEFWGQRVNGEVFPKDVRLYPGDYFGQRVLIALARDITQQRRAEEQLRASLQEKEVLVKEVHHRVKNNLQVMVSLLSLQADQIQDAESLALFRDTQERVRSMALVHEKLYRSPDLARINFAEYLRELTDNLIAIFRVSPAVTLDVQSDDIWLGVDTAIPCGLIVNELVSNALKYAFPVERGGVITVRLREEHLVTAGPRRFSLLVQDDGVGLPPELDVSNTRSLGLQLVHILARQLQGQVSALNYPGAAFTVELTER